MFGTLTFLFAMLYSEIFTV